MNRTGTAKNPTSICPMDGKTFAKWVDHRKQHENDNIMLLEAYR
jgi:hypothetical protein